MAIICQRVFTERGCGKIIKGPSLGNLPIDEDKICAKIIPKFPSTSKLRGKLQSKVFKKLTF